MVNQDEWEHYIESGEMRLRLIEDHSITVGVHTDNEECWEVRYPTYVDNKFSHYTFGDEHDTIEEAIEDAEENVINWDHHIVRGAQS